MKRKLMMFFALFFIGIGITVAQTQVRGTVADETGEPVIGATIQIKGTSQGTVTDIDGNFNLSAPAGGTLVVSYVGFQTQEVPVGADLKIVLVPDARLLEEVMVVAYGTAKKESFTGSAAVITTDKIDKRTVSDITKALDGQAPGLLTTSGGGQPGEGASVRIRGYGSINAAATPLYVVDGIPYDGALNAINPEDIESMTILKDASAGALYGARGANGVIIITTKKGREGKTQINFKASYGWASRAIDPYAMVNQKEYVQLTYEALRNGYVFNSGYDWDVASNQARSELSSTLGGEIYNPFKNYTWDNIINPTTGQVQADAVSAWDENWVDAVSRSSAPRQEYQLSFSGGTNTMQSLFSFGYLKEDGVLENTGFERFSGRVSVDNQAKFWLKSGLSASFSSSTQNYSTYTGSSTANVWYTAQFMAPIFPVYEKDLTGNDVLDANGKRQFDYGSNRPKANNFSALATLYDDKSDRKNDNLSARSYLVFGSDEEKAGSLKGLKLNLNFGVDYRNQNRLVYYNMYHGNFATSGGLMSKYNTRMLSHTFNQLLTYNRKFDQHSFDALIGHESYAYKYNYLLASRTGLVEGIYELAPASTVKDADSYEHNYTLESYLANINYNYDERYYFSTSFRRDGSSRFYKDNRWGNFWSVGANWRISQEEFLRDADWLDNLSIKASYGVQGNDNILDPDQNPDYYLWASYYDYTWPNAYLPGATISSLENRKITWEKNHNLNIGFESRFLNRFDLSVEYYNRKTEDMLLKYPMALSTGFSGYNENVGNIRNSGLEFTIGAQIVNKPDFTWRATLMGSTVNNKVLKLTNTEKNEIISGVYAIKEGYELNTFYMAKSAGVDPLTGAQLYWAYDSMDDNGKAVGEYITSDYSKASTSKYFLGSRIPDLYGSLSMDFTFLKSFDLSLQTTYSIGGKIYESLYLGSMNIMYNGDTWNKHALRRWQKPGDVTDVPRVEINPQYTQSDRFLVDASYFAIKNVTLGYTLPNKLLKKIDFNTLRLFCTLDNFALFSHLDGMDPQYNFSGGTAYTYTPNKTFSIGVDVKF